MWSLFKVRPLVSVRSTILRFVSSASYMPSMVFLSKVNIDCRADRGYSICRYHASSSEAEKSFTLFKAFPRFMDNTAIIDHFGPHTYRDILHFSCKLAIELIDTYGNKQEGLKGARVGLLCESNVSFIVSLYACWLAGGVAVQLGILNPISVEYRLRHSGCSLIMATEDFMSVLLSVNNSKDIATKILTKELYVKQFCKSDTVTARNSDSSLLQFVDSVTYLDRDKPAMIQYKTELGLQMIGVVLTFGNIQKRMQSAYIERNWKQTDIGFLSSHTFQGSNLIEFVLVAHSCGALCVTHDRFYPMRTWYELIGIRNKRYSDYEVTKFQGPVTMFKAMLQFLQKDPSEMIQKQIKNRGKVELMCVGDNYRIIKDWKLATGKKLGCTIGMEETGPIMDTTGMSARYLRLGALFGRPCGGLSYRIAVYGETSWDVVYENVGIGITKRKKSLYGLEGELQLKGDSVFKEYFKDDARTRNAFTEDGWFKTGIVALHSHNDNIIIYPPAQYRWQDGKTARVVDRGFIFKILCDHHAIRNLLVLRRPNHIQKESVAVAVHLKPGASLALDDIRDYCATKMEATSYDNLCEGSDLSFLYPSMLLILKEGQLETKRKDTRLIYSILLQKHLYKNHNIQIHHNT